MSQENEPNDPIDQLGNPLALELVRADNRYTELQHANELLRAELADVYRQLQAARERHSLVLPDVRTTTHRVWSVPLIYPPLSSRLVPSTLDERREEMRSGCVLTFARDWCDRGVFWRVLPFTTSPQEPKR